MSRIAYIPLLYGASYLREAAMSVAPHVDKIHVLYTKSPSFGHGTTLQNPDTEEMLRERIEPLGKQVEWHTGNWRSEEQHRNAIFSIAPDATTILPLDSDEVWSEDDLVRCIDIAERSEGRNFLIQGWHHFWRSFGYSCQDVWAPVRIIRPQGRGDVILRGLIYHFGYCITPELMRFKISCHGHHDEWRKNWFEDKFLANAKEDVHPTCLNWWNAEPFDKTTLPNLLKENPNYWKEVIE